MLNYDAKFGLKSSHKIVEYSMIKAFGKF